MGSNSSTRVRLWANDFFPDTMLNHHLSQKHKLIGNDGINFLILQTCTFHAFGSQPFKTLWICDHIHKYAICLWIYKRI